MEILVLLPESKLLLMRNLTENSTLSDPIRVIRLAAWKKPDTVFLFLLLEHTLL